MGELEVMQEDIKALAERIQTLELLVLQLNREVCALRYGKDDE